MTCPQLVESGAYVLGALSPSQRAAFERHMSTCAECQAEVNDLAVIPGLLGRLDEATVVAGAADPAPAPSLVEGAMRRLRRKRRGRRVLALAAGFAVACLALVAGITMPQFVRSTPPAVAVALHAMQPVNNNNAVTAELGFKPIDGGTQIEVKCSYGWEAGTTYTGRQKFDLFVYPRSGAPAEQVSSWWASPGQTVEVPGVTAWSTKGMARVELRNDEGQPILVYNVT